MKNYLTLKLLKSFSLIIYLIFISDIINSQTVIARQDFELVPATPTMIYSNANGNGSLGSVTPGYPAGATTNFAGSRGFYRPNGTATFTSNNIDSRCFSSPSVTFRLAALASSTGNGMEAADNVTVSISTNGGTSYTTELRVQGNGSQPVWTYTGGTGIASATYDGNGTIETVKTFSPTAGAIRTTDGFSTVTLTAIPRAQNLRIRITLNTDNASETWAIDNVVLSNATVGETQPAPPTTTSSSFCNSGSSAQTLSASGAGAGQNYKWYDQSSAGTLVQTNGSTFTTPSLSANKSYFVTVYNTTSTCESSRAKATAYYGTPQALTATPASANVCKGSVQAITTSTEQLSAGTATTAGALTDYPSPFSVWYGGSKHQFIILASELTAAGFKNGSVINSISFNNQSVGTAQLPLVDYKVKMGHTAQNTMTTTFINTASTTVYGPETYPSSGTVKAGLNTIDFATSFVWNGTSNIFVETSFSIEYYGEVQNGVAAYYHTTASNLTAFYRVDNTPSASVEAQATATSVTTRRPDFILSSPSLVWSPNTELFSDINATNAYSGNFIPTIYAKPTVSRTYTVTSFNGTCSSSNTSALIVIEPSVAPTSLSATSTTICRGSSTTLTQNGGTLGSSASWRWYSDAAFTTLVGTSTLANGSISVSPTTTTTYYVRAEGTASPCTNNVSSVASITINVDQPSIAPTGLSASLSTICNGSSVTLTQIGGTLGVGAIWKWYSNSTFTSLVSNASAANANLVVTPSVTTTYYLRAENVSSACTSTYPAPGFITVTVNQPSTPPSSLNTPIAIICNGTNTSVTQTGGTLGSGAIWRWYSDPAFTNLVGSSTFANASLAVSPTTTTTYYLRAEGTNAPCSGIVNATGSVTISVNQASVSPVSINVTATNICNGSSVTLSQSGGSLGTGAIWRWYSNPGFTTLVGSSSAPNASLTISPTTTTTYYLRAEGTTSPCANIVTFSGSRTVTVQQRPTASAGGVVNAFMADYITVSGASATNGTILWTHNGTGYFDETYFPVGNQTTVTPTYYIEEGDFGRTVNLTMTVSGIGSCSAFSANANYTINVDGRPALYHYQCGSTVPYIDEYIYAYAYPGATRYRYRITDNGGTTYQIMERTQSVFFFRQFPSYKYNTTYTCDVAALVGGVWTAYGPTCNITTPIVPTTELISSQRGITLAALNTTIFANTVWGVELYEFSVFDGLTTQTFQSSNNNFNMTQLPSHAYGTTYTIRVRVRYNGVWTSFGTPYNITTPTGLTKLISTQCGITLTDMNTDIYADNVVGATAYRFKLTNGATTLLLDKPSRTFKASQVANIAKGVTYSVQVAAMVGGIWKSYAASCNLTTPASTNTELISSQRNITLTNISTDLYANALSGATSYRFRVTNGASVQTIVKASRTFKLSQLPFVHYGSTLSIDVDAMINGIWIGYGTAYSITTPTLPLTKIQTSQCGITLTSIGTLIYADAIPGVSQYRFRVTNSTLGYNQTRDKLSGVFRLSEFTGLAVNTQYTIDVSVNYNGIWQPFGTTCMITTPGALAAPLNNNLLLPTEEVKINDINEDMNKILGFNNEQLVEDISIFPNPSNDEFYIKNSPINCLITIFDSNGKIVDQINKNTSNIISFGKQLEDGMYLVELKFDDKIQFFKIMKNN